MDSRKRVLFVCIGNACRSQMAEAFARAYGSDVLVPASAGLAPAIDLAPETISAMDEKNLDLRDHFPKSIPQLGRARFDYVVNMTGLLIPLPVEAAVESWNVPDPVSMSYEDHCKVRDEIERRVMQLVLALRNPPNPPDLATDKHG